MQGAPRATSSWNTKSVISMANMFYNDGMFDDASSFNGNLSAWDTSSVIDMRWMFFGATSFNSDLSAWNTSSVRDMSSMFFRATSFNSDLSSWDISSVADMNFMFQGATSFNQDLCAWGDKSFPYNNASGVFFGSGCTYQDTPQEDQKGPFCASDCNGDTASPNLRSSGAVY